MSFSVVSNSCSSAVTTNGPPLESVNIEMRLDSEVSMYSVSLDGIYGNVLSEANVVSSPALNSCVSSFSLKKPSPLDQRLDLLKFVKQFVRVEKNESKEVIEEELRIVSTWSQQDMMNTPSVASMSSLNSEMSLMSMTSDRSLANMIKDDYFKVPEKKEKKNGKRKRSLIYDKKTGIFLSVFNLINDVLSPGTLSMSQMTAQSGIFSSLILTVFFGLVTLFTLMILYELRRKYLKTSLLELSELAFGKPGVVIASIPILLFNFGGALGMFIMFGHLVPDLLLLVEKNFSSILSGYSFLFSRESVLIILTIIMIPFALRKNLGSYAITSFISVSSVLLVGIWLAIEKMTGQRALIPSSNAFDFAKSEILSAFGALAFIYVCHDIVFHIFSNLRRPTRFRFFLVALFVVIITILTITCVGMSGYLIFYDKCLDDANVLNLFPFNDPMAIIARIIISLNIIMSIPYALFMPRDCLHTLLKTILPKVYKRIQKTKVRRNILHVILTMTVLLTSFGVAIGVTDLGIVADLFGAVAASSLAYIIPPSLYLKLEFSFGCSLKRSNDENIELSNTKSVTETNNTIIEHPLEEYYAKKSNDAHSNSLRQQLFRILIGVTCMMVLLLGIFILVGTITSVIIHKFV
ncbi:predicted protein [Naegleria gruberi]|uniref:Predicted protein n=1 Tax=Naegleria gruberi TaxID=5762 RepID=D2VWK4_NAEGR|nr:uncharacterized protein NAEGRDRAFT_73411 [Naegleria gruberi]EFC38857.1 predicted protein [Naegleria gruberi]|eukprot:XP_002671601.1 predicted protein [Naegleria gruberi strain NEG-M]